MRARLYEGRQARLKLQQHLPDNMQEQRKTRIRKRLKARTTRARLTVFVSNKQIYAQIIDDAKGHTLVSA